MSLPLCLLSDCGNTYLHTYSPTSPERRACETPPPSLEHPSLSNSQPSKQGPAEDISPASQGSQAAEIEESYPPGTQAAGIQDLGCQDVQINGSYHLIFFYRGSTRAPQAATGRHRPPDLLAQNPANLPKSVLPPAQECQIAHLGTLATPVEPRWHQGLPADAKDGQRPPKCHSDSSQICRQAIKKTSIHASKPRVPEVGGRGGSLFNSTKPLKSMPNPTILDKNHKY